MPVIAERHQTHSPLSITADSLLTDDSSCGGPGAGAGTRPVTLPRDKFSGTPEPDTDTDAALAAMASAVRIQASPSCSSQDSFETLSSSSSSVISAHDARQMLNQYRIVSDLGEGAFSKVKLAKSTTTGAFFAIKFVDRALIASTPSYVENIAVEIEIMSSLSHPSVISFVELIETPTHQCLVTEYVPGIELFEYVLLQDEQLHESIVRSIFRQIAQALPPAVAYLHENLVAHRDIKLENIMIDMSGGAGAPRIKLIDFGLATRISPPALLRERCGSEEYAAPELVQSLPYDGRKVDVWAMGIVLFSMLFKSMPFSCAQSGGTGTLRAMFHRIARADYRIPPDHARSPAAVDLLRAILVANPARRLASDRVADSEWLAGWTPPNWLFGPMWAYLYISMGYASYLVYTNTTSTPASREMALTLYALHLALNFSWPPLFFGFRKFGAASAEILALLGLIIATGVKFHEIDPVAGYLMIPYAGWITLASSLSCWIWWHNPAGGKTKGQ
nr:Serine/threonine-protein kinase par-1 [Polyrhizophydium stewartii]